MSTEPDQTAADAATTEEEGNVVEPEEEKKKKKTETDSTIGYNFVSIFHNRDLYIP